MMRHTKIVISIGFIVIFSLILFLSWYIPNSLLAENWISAFDNAGIVLGYIFSLFTISLAFTGVIVGWLKRREIKKWFSKPTFYNTGEDFQIPKEKVDALVIPVSRREQPEWLIRHLRPKYAALLYTKRSKEAAKDLVNFFGDNVKFFHPKSGIEKEIDMIKDPDDPSESKELTRKYIRHFFAEGLQPSNIFVDTTGGKVPMSIGSFQAAEEERVSSIYLVGTQDDGTGNLIIKDPKQISHGRPVYLSNRT